MRDRRGSRGWWLGLGLVGLGCGPQVETPDDGGDGSTTVASTETTSSPGTTLPQPETSVGPGLDSTATTSADDGADAELCLEWCVNAEARGCAEGFHDEACYTRCLARLEMEAASECEAESRAVLACEAQAGPPAELSCESLACEDEYKRDDLCVGYCFHLGGYPGSGGSPESCDWRSDCYGHEFEAVCPVQDAAGLCSCFVDGRVVAECEVGESLAPFDCGLDEIHVFTSCCREAFEEVLFP